jgi:hypothetical protein
MNTWNKQHFMVWGNLLGCTCKLHPQNGPLNQCCWIYIVFANFFLSLIWHELVEYFYRGFRWIITKQNFFNLRLSTANCCNEKSLKNQLNFWWELGMNPYEFYFKFFILDSTCNSGEKYLKFSPPFSVKNVWKTKDIFHCKLCWNMKPQYITNSTWAEYSSTLFSSLCLPIAYWYLTNHLSE